jgi:murein L,D-transpeptidase YafK
MRLLKYLLALCIVAPITAISIIIATRYDSSQPYFSSETYWFAKTANIKEVRKTLTPYLVAELREQKMSLKQPIFLRIFKEEAQLEVWKQLNGVYKLFKTYDICSYSGELGPKLKEGDKQAPEGFYQVTAHQLNPKSVNHLAFNLGFPNAFDKSNNRTGSFLMVHGNCLSAGCYAMTDKGMEEIYLLVEHALLSGQNSVAVHIFPFHMTEANMAPHASNRWFSYWKNLQKGYSHFSQKGVPPQVSVVANSYAFK